jgi:hypothetical protein
MPRLGVDGLTDRSKDPECAEIVALEMMFAQAAEETNGSRRGIELGDLVALNDIPVTRGGWVDRSALEHGRSDTVEERTVDDVGVSSNPANVGHAGEFVFWVDIEDIFDGECRAEKVSASGLIKNH